MGFDDGAIDQQVATLLLFECLSQCFPPFSNSPPTIATIHRVPLAESFWQVSPWCTSAQHTEHCFDEAMVIRSLRPARGQCSNTTLQLNPPHQADHPS